jgi:mono/diheme cytochrome c family protein
MRELTAAAVVAVLGLVTARPVGATEDLGRQVYADRCTACHGVDGYGDGPVAASLDPRPQNFHDATFWKTHTLDDLRTIVRDGRPGTLMQAFGGVLSGAEIDAVVRHLTTFRPKEGSANATRGDGAAPGARPGEDTPGGARRR